jgi:hypothetical protein
LRERIACIARLKCSAGSENQPFQDQIDEGRAEENEDNSKILQESRFFFLSLVIVRWVHQAHSACILGLFFIPDRPAKNAILSRIPAIVLTRDMHSM